ncbi:hypothetical protein GCM10009655_09620 [Rhodoglobus aureus]|uniref:Uncharacterized protein n=1 Tax=Rhodoglobus aureus TaxID=191497 RepID=A0ABN1VI23_9MICO
MTPWRAEFLRGRLRSGQLVTQFLEGRDTLRECGRTCISPQLEARAVINRCQRSRLYFRIQAADLSLRSGQGYPKLSPVIGLKMSE